MELFIRQAFTPNKGGEKIANVKDTAEKSQNSERPELSGESAPRRRNSKAKPN